jgi:hypothetical protein
MLQLHRIFSLSTLGHLTFLLLFVLSFLFWETRVLFSDVANMAFKIIIRSDFDIEHQRYIQYLTQFLPVLATKTQIELKWILILYSLNFIFISYLFYVYVLYRLKSPKFATILVLQNIGIVCFQFFWCPSEIVLGLQFLTIFWAIVYERKSFFELRLDDGIMLFLSLFMAISSHPLILLPVLFSIAFIFLSSVDIDRKFLWSIIGTLFLFSLFRNLVFPLDGYEQAQSAERIESIKHNWNISIGTPVMNSFLICLRNWYLLLPILLVSNTIGYILQKKWLKIGLLWVSVTGYIQLLHASTPNAGIGSIESYYLGLVFILGLPFVLDVLPMLSHHLNKKILFPILCLFLIWRINCIYDVKEAYIVRNKWMNDLVDKMSKQSGSKFLMDDTKVDNNLLIYSKWTTAMETLMLSVIKYPDNPKTVFVTSNPHQFDAKAKELTTLIIDGWNFIPYDQLPKHYFPIKPCEYQFITPEGDIIK